MPDDLERHLEAFGETLSEQTGEPITGRSSGGAVSRVPRRWWAIGGAAACLVAVVVGLAAIAGRDRVKAPAAVPESTTVPPTIPVVLAAVPDDPLGLERDGWTLVQRTSGPFEFSADDIPCPEAAEFATYAGLPEVHDILTPPGSASLDLDVQVLDVGSLDRGNELASAVLAIGDCIAETQGIEVETAAMSSVRASWFRAGPDFALATIVGEGSRSIVLEIENDTFPDGLIAELAHRSADFLRTGEPAATP